MWFSYAALRMEDPIVLHAEPEHHISLSDQLEVNFLIGPCVLVFGTLPPDVKVECIGFVLRCLSWVFLSGLESTCI